MVISSAMSVPRTVRTPLTRLAGLEGLEGEAGRRAKGGSHGNSPGSESWLRPESPVVRPRGIKPNGGGTNFSPRRLNGKGRGESLGPARPVAGTVYTVSAGYA